MLLRFVEMRSQVHRVVSVLKLRDSEFDPRIREFLITSRGLDIGESFGGQEAILTGVARSEPKGPRTQAKPPKKGKKSKPLRRRESSRRG
jgi:circadian clock protein KaiC